MTSMPCFARCRAVLLPSPRLPPVTRAIGTVVVVLIVCSLNRALLPTGGGRILSCDALARGAISAHGEQKPNRRSAHVLSVYNSMAESINGAARLARLRSVVDLGDEA